MSLNQVDWSAHLNTESMVGRAKFGAQRATFRQQADASYTILMLSGPLGTAKKPVKLFTLPGRI